MKHEVLSSARPFERLSRLDGYAVESHHVDPRGWTVINAEGRNIGEVKDLVVDTERMSAAYLDVELDTKLFDLHDDPRVLVPIQRAQRDGTHRRLRVDGLSRERVASLWLARDASQREFWNRWWEQTGAVTHRHDWTPGVTRRAPAASPTDVKRAIETVRPGETVRIPLVNEEIVVERRPVGEPTRPPAETVRSATTQEIVTARERVPEDEPIHRVVPREEPPRAL
jgi:hypothetical protein